LKFKFLKFELTNRIAEHVGPHGGSHTESGEQRARSGPWPSWWPGREGSPADPVIVERYGYHKRDLCGDSEMGLWPNLKVDRTGTRDEDGEQARTHKDFRVVRASGS
jgi:hypothetical protein